LPSLLLAPELQDVAMVPVRAGAGGAERRAEGRDLVGESSPLAPQAVGRRAGRPLPGPARVLVFAPRLDPAPRLAKDRREGRPGPDEVSRAALLEPPFDGDGAHRRARARLLFHRGCLRARLGLLRLDGAALARVVFG